MTEIFQKRKTEDLKIFLKTLFNLIKKYNAMFPNHQYIIHIHLCNTLVKKCFTLKKKKNTEKHSEKIKELVHWYIHQNFQEQ